MDRLVILLALIVDCGIIPKRRGEMTFNHRYPEATKAFDGHIFDFKMIAVSFMFPDDGKAATSAGRHQENVFF